MHPVVIVEGKNDRRRLQQVLCGDVHILCTFGTPGTERLEKLKQKAKEATVYIFTDHDAAGRRIRGILTDLFPHAEHIYTRKGYAGVEGTPLPFLIQQLEKAGLEAYLLPSGTEWGDLTRFVPLPG